MMTRPKIQVVEIKPIKVIALPSGSKNAGGKNEGKFHYVIENKRRKNVRNRALHYVIENKAVEAISPLY
jgi:hypothetical protein